MECSLPPPLTDDEISAALDGEAALSVQEHLAQCPHCAARLEEARLLEQRLKRALHRWHCPTTQELGDYVWGVAEEARAQIINAHLELCIRCGDEVSELRRFLETEIPLTTAQPAQMPAPQVGKRRWRELVAQLLPRSPTMAMRGADEGPLVAQASGMTIFLALEKTAQGTALSGQIAADDQIGWVGAIVEVRQNNTLQAAVIVDEWGSFRQEPFVVQQTDLRITAADGRMVSLNEVNFTGHGI